MKEIFKPVPIAPNFLLGNNGTLLNPYGRKCKLLVHKTGSKLPNVEYCFRVNGRQVYLRADRLVAELFIPIPESVPPGSLAIIPKDGNIFNIAAENLKWATRSDRMKFSKKIGNKYVAKKSQQVESEVKEDSEFGGAF